MCASLTTLLCIFLCFPFCRKTKYEKYEKYDVLSNCFKIQQLQLSLEEKSTFFRGTGSNDGFFSATGA